MAAALVLAPKKTPKNKNREAVSPAGYFRVFRVLGPSWHTSYKIKNRLFWLLGDNSGIKKDNSVCFRVNKVFWTGV